MKRHTAILTMLLAGVMVVLAGCQEPLDFKVKKGESIRVRVSSRNGVSTKVAYSGQTYTENGITYERIDWKVNDQIRLFSTDVSEVATSDGKAYFDYSISAVGTNDPADRYSNATLSFPENHERYGLIWVNEPTATVTVYGIYPPMDEKGEEQEAVTNGGNLTGFVGLNIPAPDLSWSNGVGTPTDDYMKHAYMVSAPTKFSTTSTDPNWNGKPYVDLDFYPIFNAFYVELKGSSTSGEFPVNWVSLSNEVESGSNPNAALTGDYRFNYKERNGDNITFDASGPIAASITQTGNKGHTVTVNLPANTTISSEKSVKFTILTLPPTSTAALTNLVLTVNFGTGTGQTKKLRLNEKVTASNQYGTPIDFPAFHKARITGLALEGGTSWKLKVDALPWTLVEESTSFAQNIQSTAFNIANATETDNNYFPAGTKDYQVRTLDMSKDYGTTEGVPNKAYFLVTFRPQAPLGGYWMLDPQTPNDGHAGMGTAAFKVEVWDNDSNTGSSDLKGQIMGKTVTLHVTCDVDDTQRNEDHAIIIKSYFSTSVNFDENSTFSADSEIQDVHKDGSFSFWRFVIPAKNN